MDNQSEEKESADKRNSNTEYLPTKCRITRPPPPKPATNPLQFIKVAPCSLFRKAQEQIKRVEEIKSTRPEVREDAEDWQQNLDNWKSSRRKRQEHIIERVVEVKKFEQEEHRSRRKSKTFSEIIEERNKSRHKFNIPIYIDDSNDLSDYGIGSNDSKTNSIKDIDTNDSESILGENCCDSSTINQHTSVPSNESQIENTLNNLVNTSKDKEDKTVISVSYASTSLPSLLTSTYTTSLYTNLSCSDMKNSPSQLTETKLHSNNIEEKTLDTKVYTYEGAIQDYRAKMKSRINLDDSFFKKPSTPDSFKSKEYTEAQMLLPKGQIFKRKELFEIEKPIEIDNRYESKTSRPLTVDINVQSIKQRLKSLEKCREQMLKNDNKCELTVGSVKEKLQNFHKRNEADNKNNNNYNCIFSSKSMSSFLVDKSNSGCSDFDMKLNTVTLDWKPKDEISDCSYSPETEIYMGKLNMFNRDLDNLMYSKLPHTSDSGLDDYYLNLNYPPSASSIDLMGASSDREDSGIHTADVSCSVSQADEPVEDSDLASTMIPKCIEKLKNENFGEIEESTSSNHTFENEEKNQVKIDVNSEVYVDECEKKTIESRNHLECSINFQEIIGATKEFLNSARKDAACNIQTSVVNNNRKHEEAIVAAVPSVGDKVVVYENVETKPLMFKSPCSIACITIDLFDNPPKTVEPPKVKPPPPPPPDDKESRAKPTSTSVKRLNSTKRIKKELDIKRSSFLGLQESTVDQVDPDISIDRPPDINVFLQNESKLEKSLYKKMQESRESELSKVASQDSGLDIERGRLSSDTWCSSVGDSSHGRQDSEPTNSIISEEEEIMKKEREIIEMVEKEEKSRDNPNFTNKKDQICEEYVFDSNLAMKTDRNSCLLTDCNDLDMQDSEVLKVEHQLLQLEKEELKRQQESLLFRQSCAKAKLQKNRHSLENICENIDVFTQYDRANYRKSMPELQMTSNDCCKSQLKMPSSYYKMSSPHLNLMYRKSIIENNLCTSFDNQKSLADLQQDTQIVPFHPSSAINKQPILPGKPARPLFKEHKDRESYALSKQTCQIPRYSLQALNAVPRQRHVPNDYWIQSKAHIENKSNNQHWLIHEAELRRLSSDQQKTAPPVQNRKRLQSSQDKHIPDSVIQTLTQRVQNRTNSNDKNSAYNRSENNSKDYIQRPYVGNKQTVGHVAPIPFPPSIALEDSQERVLSVSGKKKCSYCGNELGRGAAMIIESLSLFYHMECFKCCVCHIQLGDGMMGTDVRVRNQKLHCHNCYSSDDGVKFSCV